MAADSSGQAREDKVQLLLRASATLIGSLSVEETLSSLLRVAQELTGAAACAIWRRAAEEPSWSIVAGVGLSAEFQQVPVSNATMDEIGDEPLCFADVHKAAAVS